MKFRSALLSVALAAALPLNAFGCGPDFPADLLSARDVTMNQLPEGAFVFEVQHLLKPTTAFKVVEGVTYPADGSNPLPDRESVERAWWGDQYARIASLRDSPSAAAAYAAGAGLPEEVRRYQAGAAAWAKRDWEEARRRFAAVRELPAAERAHYGLWAEYMLGRLAGESNLADAGQNGDTPTAAAAAKIGAPATRDDVEAAAHFSAVRSEVGANPGEDVLGLAAASWGEQARVSLDAGDDATAIALYAQQAALGSASGSASLLQIARAVIKAPARLDKLVADPLGQRLMTVYLFTRSGELGDTPVDDPASTPAQQAQAQAAGAQRIEQFLAAVERHGLDPVAGADRLAALAYRSGKFDMAGKLAARDTTGLAWWIRAKLALRGGDANGAALAYAQAAKAFPAGEQWGSDMALEMGLNDAIKPQCRVEGERGTLALSRGEYVAAMGYLYNAASQYWPDAAYVAERVLSIDELKNFVDAHVTAIPIKPRAEGDYGRYGIPDAPANALRALLGRRLLRAERFDDALDYFEDPALKAKAKTYVDARRGAQGGDQVEQAKAWYAAARSARVDGLEILGYELDPDYAMYDGQFDLGEISVEEDAAKVDVATMDKAASNFLARRTDLIVPKTFAGPDEARRVAAARADPLKRFHYRYSAVDFAQKSADLLPPRTQAFAAVLCHATGWLIDRDPEVAGKLYGRYIKQGPYLAWAASFGRTCPEPNFAGAALRLRAERIAWWKRTIRHDVPYVAIGLGVLLLVFVLWRRSRRV
jgi:cellulose synthase operon protein C